MFFLTMSSSEGISFCSSHIFSKIKAYYIRISSPLEKVVIEPEDAHSTKFVDIAWRAPYGPKLNCKSDGGMNALMCGWV